MLETEFKCIINKETYERLKKEFRWNSCREQINHYYVDKNGIIVSKRIMVRVREIDGTYKLQVKFHKNSDSPLQICEENEYKFYGIPKTISAADAKKYINEDTELHLAGKLRTLRRSCKWGLNTEICLDKSTYVDTTDYEIEVEYSGEVDKELLGKLSELGVEFKQNSVGKFARFWQRCKELNMV